MCKFVRVILYYIVALLLSNLDPLTVEDTVWESLQAVTPLFVKNVNIGRDTLTGMSRSQHHPKCFLICFHSYTCTQYCGAGATILKGAPEPIFFSVGAFGFFRKAKKKSLVLVICYLHEVGSIYNRYR